MKVEQVNNRDSNETEPDVGMIEAADVGGRRPVPTKAEMSKLLDMR